VPEAASCSAASYAHGLLIGHNLSLVPLAGRPNREALLEAAGVDGFISAGGDAIATLTPSQSVLGAAGRGPSACAIAQCPGGPGFGFQPTRVRAGLSSTTLLGPAIWARLAARAVGNNALAGATAGLRIEGTRLAACTVRDNPPAGGASAGTGGIRSNQNQGSGSRGCQKPEAPHPGPARHRSLLSLRGCADQASVIGGHVRSWATDLSLAGERSQAGSSSGGKGKFPAFSARLDGRARRVQACCPHCW
jgi:hypothetical protein